MPGGAGAGAVFGQRGSAAGANPGGLQVLDAAGGLVSRQPRAIGSRARSRGAVGAQGGLGPMAPSGGAGSSGLITLAPEGSGAAGSIGAGSGTAGASRRVRRRVRRAEGSSGDVVVPQAVAGQRHGQLSLPSEYAAQPGSGVAPAEGAGMDSGAAVVSPAGSGSGSGTGMARLPSDTPSVGKARGDAEG